MGYGGKMAERQRARELRAESWTLQEIAQELGVAKSAVSRWVRDVEFEPRPRNRGHPSQRPHPMKLRKEAEIAQCGVEAKQLVGALSDRDLTMFALGLYAGEGAKTDTGSVAIANTNPAYLGAFLRWFRGEFDVDESRLRVRLYLHDGLDLDGVQEFWSECLKIPLTQFGVPYRAAAKDSRRTSKHPRGRATIVYSCTSTYRRVMAMIAAVASRSADPG